MKTVVYAIAKNETNHISRWVESAREADAIYVLDTGSADGTPELLASRGIIVESQSFEPFSFDNARNAAHKMIPNDVDVCVLLDSDETLTPGWRNELEIVWHTDKPVLGKFTSIWNTNPDGSTGATFISVRAHSRHEFRWIYPIYETLTTIVDAEYDDILIPNARLFHLPDNEKSRERYLEMLKQTAGDYPRIARMTYYLSREYMHREQYEKCIATLSQYATMPGTWTDERCAACCHISKSYRMQGNAQAALPWSMRAAAECSATREAWLELSLTLYAAILNLLVSDIT